jgi:tetraacyldisaccharide 4'-kinase
MLSTVYAAIARRRREWYAARPDMRRRLRHPVISIGNIAAGGRGKTPFTAAVARLLLAMGETPAILSRGYGRTNPVDGAVVVRDAHGIRADLARSGDEPLMLARQLDGAIVVTGADRYISGRLAEHHLGATVHLLDDGFQHFALDRDVDIVLVSTGDLAGAKTLPAGPLREPPDVLIAADAIVCIDEEIAISVPDIPVFRAARTPGAVVFDEAGPAPPSAGASVIAVAGIANPAPFFDAVTEAGWHVTARRTFRDHHPFTAADVAGIANGVAAANAAAVITTEKDYVRLLPHRPFPVAVGWLPHTITPEPAAEFRRWLAVAVGAARDTVIG